MRMTMTSTAWRLGLAALVVLAGLGGATTRAAALKWKFQQGETLHYVMDQTVTTSLTGGPQDIKTTTNQTIDMQWNVKEVAADGAATLTQTVTRVRTKIESPFATFEYDSKAGKDPEGPIAAGIVPLLKALIGAEFSFKMSPQGELTDVKIPESLSKAMREAGPAGGGSMFSEEGLKNMVTESSLAIPGGDLEKGKSWTKQTKIPMPPVGDMMIDKTYSFQGADSAASKDVMRIDLQTKVEVKPMAGSNLDIRIKSQDGKGSFFFNNASGRVSDSKVSEKIELVFKVQDKEVTQANETTTRMKLGAGN